mmetsp:Transcript_3983/g.9488  ORF Transcript_3983/g.9488 Transcript_3983/m.9488 type:complete len:371 (+) Transcript_3983:99-1211(+)
MKFSAALLFAQLLALACSASAMFEFDTSRRLSGKSRGMRKLLEKARRLDEDGGDDDNADVDMADVEAFLMDYSMKFMSCHGDQVLTDADYNDHFGVVIFRLCPSNTCSDDNGCKSGYADFAVDVGTYVDAFLDDQGDNMNWDDKFGDVLGECAEFETENDDGSVYYVGPGCTEDETGIKMGVYEDQYCYQESSTDFATISNGWTLPYSDGGLVTTQCIGCTDDDGAIKEICTELYEDSPYRCEAEFDFKHYYYDVNFEMYRYGQDTTGCNKIDVLSRPRSTFSNDVMWTDAILVLMLVVVTGAGFSYYSQWWEKQKENLEKIDDEDEDDDDYHLDDDKDSDYGSGEENNDSALNTSAESNYERYEGGTLT